MIYIITTERGFRRKFAVEASSSKQAVEFLTDNIDSLDFFVESPIREEPVDIRPVSEDDILGVIAEEMAITDEDFDDGIWDDDMLESYINIIDEE